MPFYVIDLFCGAGGFSEGIIQAGLDIVFSSDRSSEVQRTYMNRHKQLGLIENVNTHFELADIKELTSSRILESINNLEDFISQEIKIGIGDIDAVFGGPPCQGFSRAGKRNASDPRNMLFHEYLRIIKELKPKYVVMENVEGFMDMCMLDFPSVLSKDLYRGQKLARDILTEELSKLGYNVLPPQVVNASDFGVPQNRKRAVFLANRLDVREISYPEKISSCDNQKVSVQEALSGIFNNETSLFGVASLEGRTPSIEGYTIEANEIKNNETSTHSKSVVQRFSLYKQGESTRDASQRIKIEGLDLRKKCPELFFETLFHLNRECNKVELIHILDKLDIDSKSFHKDRWLGDTNKILSILAIPNLNQKTYKEYFKKLKNRLSINEEKTQQFLIESEKKLNKKITSRSMAAIFRNGTNITDEMFSALFTKKNSRRRLSPSKQSPTMVTLPDDFIHPLENRVLTVREMARFQSFDDSFEFLGKRTTGGEKRKEEVPQYTQVGNAVPPLLAKAIAREVRRALEKEQ